MQGSNVRQRIGEWMGAAVRPAVDRSRVLREQTDLLIRQMRTGFLVATVAGALLGVPMARTSGLVVYLVWLTVLVGGYALRQRLMEQAQASGSLDRVFVITLVGSALIGFGQYTAFPHGSIQPQKLREGDVVLMDGGCAVEGYQSDITRTFVFGKASARQREIWNLERKAQDAALAAAKVGATCESVDAAARKVITDAGFGPDYKVPGLPHRTGHGIGLDGHEWTNFVRGNKTKLQPGMCFSDEPMIAIYGEFGIRLEDCLYIAEDGAKLFTQQSPSIDQPFG